MHTITITITDADSGRSVNVEREVHDRAYLDSTATELVEEATTRFKKTLSIPVWQDYDVIAIQFRPDDDKKYTYMRRDGFWPGASDEKATGLRDWQIDEAYEEGRVTLLARDSSPWLLVSMREPRPAFQ